MADLLQDLFDHIMALIRGGTLSKTAADFARMEADRAQMLRQDFLAALDVMRENAEKGTVAESGAKYSIIPCVVANDGTVYENVVRLDTDLFKGLKPRNWGKRLRTFVYDNLAGKQFTAFNESGAPTVIEFARANERVKKMMKRTRML